MSVATVHRGENQWRGMMAQEQKNRHQNALKGAASSTEQLKRKGRSEETGACPLIKAERKNVED
jgi:hypothetical protein